VFEWQCEKVQVCEQCVEPERVIGYAQNSQSAVPTGLLRLYNYVKGYARLSKRMDSQ
jgi:hypothetical protein